MELKNAKLVYVDDNRFNIALIKALAEEFGIDMITFLNPKEALDYVLTHKVDMVLLDYMMPEMNGIEFAKILKSKKPFIPIIMISAFDDYKLRAEAKKVGIVDFLPKPVNMDNFKLRIVDKILQMEDKFEEESFEEEKDNIYEIFSKITIPKDKTYKNIFNVASVSKIIASKLMDKEFTDILFKGSLFYDIGKNKIPAEILLKPSKLTKEEFELVKTHTLLGYEMLNRGDEILQMAAIVALNHHEKFNGEGYPRNLKENDIPLCARIVAIADVFDALVTKKVYKDSISFNEAVEIILKEKGKSFDPTLVDVFYNNIDEVRLLYL